MDIENRKLIEDWNSIRGNTVSFLENLSNEQLTMKLPRPGLDTFLKHFQEMCDVQEAYFDACETGEMVFDKVKENDEYCDVVSRQDILSKMKIQDSRLETLLTQSSKTEIVWSEDDKKTVFAQIRNLCMHEALHVGQLVAFAYVVGIAIPDDVVETWVLS